jgi:hypothetical protein
VGSRGGATVVVETVVVEVTVVAETVVVETVVEVVVVGESEVLSLQAAASITRATSTAHHQWRVMRRIADGAT